MVVLPGVELVLARFVRLNTEFIRDDVPTLERPITAISGSLNLGCCTESVRLQTNSMFDKFI